MIAFLFPGQNSQSIGMGQAWCEASELARDYFERANRVLGVDLKTICAEGPDEKLNDTLNAQPAIYTVSCIAAHIMAERGVVPEYVAGHSIGEYAALEFAEVFEFEEGLALVAERARAMAEAAAANPGTMAAVIRMDPAEIARICSEIASKENGVLAVAGFNSPEQTVISGTIELVKTATEQLKAAGARRIVPLSVSGGFHSGLMESARVRLQAAIEKTEFRAPRYNFVSNHDGALVNDPSVIAQHLPRQLTSPVRWTDSLAFLKNAGVESFVESGPGNILAGLLRKFDAGLECLELEAWEDFGLVAEKLTQ